MKNMIRLLLPLIALSLIACSGSIDNNAEDLPSVESQLAEELKAAYEAYSPNNHGFIYTVFKNDSAQIQVVHSSFIQSLNATTGQFGLAINLSFDKSISGEKENHERFKSSKHFSKFTAYKWSGIQCYALDLKTDYIKTANLTTNILIGVYDFNKSTSFSTDLYDQGPL